MGLVKPISEQTTRLKYSPLNPVGVKYIFLFL
jgi:hypothetical protein